jgi:hypothetical protein
MLTPVHVASYPLTVNPDLVGFVDGITYVPLWVPDAGQPVPPLQLTVRTYDGAAVVVVVVVGATVLVVVVVATLTVT